MLQPTPTPPRWRILWIDDEVQPDDAVVTLLAFDGFGIDLAGSGTEGLAKAQTALYDAIVLDLRLPDMFGLSLLQRLAASELAPPVLVVTGYYHEPEMEGNAIEAGAVAFRHKPLIDIEDLAAVLRSMTARHVRSKPAASPSLPLAGIAVRETAIPRPLALSVDRRSRLAQILALSRELALPHVSSLEFVTTAVRLCRILNRRIGIGRPLGSLDVLPREVRAVIQYLELKMANGHLPRETQLESELGMHRGDSGRLLTLHTGAGYREWRRALRLRPAVRPLAFSDEHIRQIAYRIGYEHPSQFDRDFYQAFGLTPTDYRRSCKAATS